MKPFIDHPERNTMAPFVFAAALLGGCSSAPGGIAPPPAGTASQPMAIVCGATTYTAPDGEQSSQPEWYVVTAMNRKLRLHPDFASAAGLSTVSSCDGARAYMKAYAAYSSAHPGFDDDPVDMPTPERLGPPPGPPPDPSQVAKILGANTNIVNTPIVNFRGQPFHLPDGGVVTNGCTGTFIARNWIVTAAHCLTPFDDAALDGQGIQIAVNSYQRYDISVQSLGPSGPFSTQIISGDASGTSLWAYQYVDPDFVGVTFPVTNTSRDSNHDFALLFLYPPYYDRYLAPHPDQGAMRIDMTAPQPSDDFWAWGYGPTQNPGTGGLLNESATEATIDQVQPLYFSQIPLLPSDVQICHGDSGGPATRSVTLGFGVRDLERGELSLFDGPNGSLCVPVGNAAYWTRLDAKLQFIESAMKNWNGPLFTCNRYNTAGVGKYARCWGDECTSIDDCPATQGANAFYCADLDPSNGVTIGQCLQWLPDTTPN